MEQAESNLDSLRVFTTEKWFVQLGMAARGIACCSKCGPAGLSLHAAEGPTSLDPSVLASLARNPQRQHHRRPHRQNRNRHRHERLLRASHCRRIVLSPTTALRAGGDTFQVISRSKNDAALYSSAVWSALSPPEAPNIRPSLTPLNCHTSILHMLALFPARLKQGIC